MTPRLSDIGPFYPDLVEAGGLLAALRKALPPQADIEMFGFETGPTYASLRLGTRSVQVFLGATERQFLPEFWERHACEAKGKTPDLEALIKSTSAWLLQGNSTTAFLSTFRFCQKGIRKPATFSRCQKPVPGLISFDSAKIKSGSAEGNHGPTHQRNIIFPTSDSSRRPRT